MSDDIIDAPPKAGKGKIALMVLIAVVMIVAGVTGGLFAAGAFGSAEKVVVMEDPNRPKLVPAGGDPVAIAAEATGGSEKKGDGAGKDVASLPHIETDFKLPKGGIELPRPKNVSKYQATYFQMPAPYTSNLADTDSLVQIALAVSTYYDARVIDAIKVHEMAIRSAILMDLAQEQAVALSTPQGKEALQHKLTALINKILREKTGYSGVDNVYFTNFIVQ